MTIKEVAELHGMSVQAVYKRIKAAGYNLTSLKDAETGQISREGQAVIFSLFENKKPSSASENELKQEVERLKLEKQQLLEKIEILEQSRDDLRNALTAAQILQKETLAKIPPALQAGEKRGFLSWLHKKH